MKCFSLPTQLRIALPGIVFCALASERAGVWGQRCLLAWAACLLLASAAWAQVPTTAPSPAAPVTLERLPQGLPLHGRVALLADPSGLLSLADVRAPEREDEDRKSVV